MRSHEDRIREVRRRITELERRKRIQRSRIALAVSVAASLILIVVLSAAMPDIADRFEAGKYTVFQSAASMSYASDMTGYVIIGFLAFVLGVIVTILCFRLREYWRDEESQDDENKNE